MIPGYEDMDLDVKDGDLPIIKLIAKGLNARLGKENAISNRQIRDIFEKERNIKLTSPRLRAMITYIRAYNMVPCLCACGNGYFKAAKEEEWEDWKASMKARIGKLSFILTTAEYFNDGQETL